MSSGGFSGWKDAAVMNDDLGRDEEGVEGLDEEGVLWSEVEVDVD
jgi:hypothetical protein